MKLVRGNIVFMYMVCANFGFINKKYNHIAGN
jgi:hypothetical protein